MVSSTICRPTNSTANPPARRQLARSPQDRRCVETGLGGEELLRLPHATQREAPDRNQTTPHLRAKRVGKVRRNEDILLDRAAHRQDSADFVYCRTDDGEIEAIPAADITVENVADMQ